jgi:O-antigen/teichoic acid export membrane protein
MFKQFIKESFVYAIGNILVRGVSYLLLPFYTRVLTPVDYGITDILFIFSTTVSLAVALEIVQGVAIYFANSSDRDEGISYSSTALWFDLVIFTIFSTICLLNADNFSQLILHQTGKSFVFSLATISTWGYGMSYLTINQFRWEHKPQQYALTGLISSIVSIGLTIILVLYQRMGAEGVVAGQMVGNLAGFLLSLYLNRTSFAWRFDFSKLWQMLRFSIPLVPSSVCSMIMIYINRIALNSLMTLSDVGIFGVAYRITSFIEFIMMGFRTALTPLFYDNYQKSETPGEIARIFKYFVAFSLLIILFLSIFAKEIVMLLSQPSYYESVKIISVLSTAYALGQINVFTLGWAVAKKTSFFAIINISGAVLALILNYALIPIIGLSGAAWANLITNAAAAVAVMTLSQRLYPVPHRWKNIFLSIALFTSLVLGTKYLLPDLCLAANILIKSVILILGGISLILTGLIHMDDVRLLIKKAYLYVAPASRI